MSTFSILNRSMDLPKMPLGSIKDTPIFAQVLVPNIPIAGRYFSNLDLVQETKSAGA